MTLPLGLILDVGHAGKPAPDHRDRGATSSGRVEADLAARYVELAQRCAEARNIAVHRIQTGPVGLTYAQRHREAVQVAQRDRSRRWLYVQAHLNSAGHDARYGLVGYDQRSSSGARAAQEIAGALVARLDTVIDRARAEAAAGVWSRMLSTIAGIYAGPSTIAGVCFEPCFIQSRRLDTADTLTAIAESLVDGAVMWSAQS
jgi:hypothetical protein